MDQRIRSKFLAQRAAVYAEDACRLALVAVGIVHDGLK